MSPTIQLLSGVFLISASVNYAWWSLLGVARLRATLAQVGIEFDLTAKQRGNYGTRDHRSGRRLIVQAIRAAHLFAWWTMIAVMFHEVDGETILSHARRKQTERASTQNEMESLARRRVVECIANHLLYHTGLGLLLIAFTGLLGYFQALQEVVREVVEQIAQPAMRGSSRASLSIR